MGIQTARMEILLSACGSNSFLKSEIEVCWLTEDDTPAWAKCKIVEVKTIYDTFPDTVVYVAIARVVDGPYLWKGAPRLHYSEGRFHAGRISFNPWKDGYMGDVR